MRFLHKLDRRGAVGVMAAIAGVMLLAFGGMSVDLERVWLVRGRLQTSLDAAGLAAARNYAQSNCTTTCTNANAVALFWANFGRNGDIAATGGTGFMAATATSPVFTPVDSTHLTITATATVPTIMLGVLSFYAGVTPATSTTMTVSTTVQRSGTGLELALVLDTTRSMGQTDSSTGGTKLAALQSAVQTMMTSLYGTNSSGTANDTLTNLSVSVVPFATAINVGSSHTNWLSSYSSSSYGSYGWAGCIGARASPYDQSEDGPYTQPLPAYLDVTTYKAWGLATASGPASGQAGCTTKQYYYGANTSSSSDNYCMGDNDWGAPSASSNPAYSDVDFSPNSGCDPVAILPLTASKTTVMNTVNNLTTFNSLGTIIGTGVQGGWFTLSPSWSGYWGTTNSPLPYNTTGMQKAMVLVSDGGTNWGYFTSGSGIAPEDERIDALYMPYGRLYNNQLGITFTTSGTLASNQLATLATANTELSKRWVATCTNMKAQGITIFVVGLGVADSTDRGNLESCASGTAGSNVNIYYFESPNASTLATAMQSVTSQLSSLTLTQ